MSPSPSLPLEIAEQILENLSTDFPSLKACAVACSSWQQATRRLLFRSRTLHHSTNYEGFLSFLQQSPHIVCCIKHLDIRGDLGPCPWMTKDLARVCAMLQEVESLLLRTVVFQFLDADMIVNLTDALKCFLSSVKDLSITHVMFDDRMQMQEFISSFPHASEVSIKGSGYMSVRPSFRRIQLLPKNRMNRPRVVSLQMDDCYSEVFTLFAQGTTLNLRHLMIHTSLPQDAQAILRLDPKALETIESLHLWLESTSNVLCNLPSKLPALTCFVVEIDVQANAKYEIEWLQEMLANLAPTVVEINIRMSGNLSEFTDWDLIDNAIDGSRSKDLKQVMVQFELHKKVPETEELLTKRLKKLKISERGLLGIFFLVIISPYAMFEEEPSAI